MGALALNQLLENSQEKGVDIQLETSSLENQVSPKPLHCSIDVIFFSC